MTTRFGTDTAVRPVGPGHFEARVDPPSRVDIAPGVLYLVYPVYPVGRRTPTVPSTNQRAFIDPTEAAFASVERSFAYFGFIWPVGAREFV